MLHVLEFSGFHAYTGVIGGLLLPVRFLFVLYLPV